MKSADLTYKPQPEQDPLQDLWLKECAESDNLPYKQHSDFQSALWAYFQLRGWNSQKFSSKTGLSEKIYSLLRHHAYEEGKRPTLESVIAMCIGLQIPIYCSLELISLCGYALTNLKKDRCYWFILSHYELFDIDKVNEFLVRHKFRPLCG